MHTNALPENALAENALSENIDSFVFDAIVIGGSYAGLSAAMQLARARRRILIIDAGNRRNRFAQKSHGFLGQDGVDAAAIARKGRAELLAYPSAAWLEGTVKDAIKKDKKFIVTLDNNETFSSKRLVLATGVIDELPQIEGLDSRWGKSIFHCPYCHGYELDNGRIGVLASGPMSLHHAMMLPDWGEVTLFTNNTLALDENQMLALNARGVVIESQAIKRIVEHATVELIDGRLLSMAGLFTLSKTRMSNSLAEKLGCAFDEGPLGKFIHTEANKETTITGVFACGDAAVMAGSVALAVGNGVMAGVSAHQSLIFNPELEATAMTR